MYTFIKLGAGIFERFKVGVLCIMVLVLAHTKSYTQCGISGQTTGFCTNQAYVYTFPPAGECSANSIYVAGGTLLNSTETSATIVWNAAAPQRYMVRSWEVYEAPEPGMGIFPCSIYLESISCTLNVGTVSQPTITATPSASTVCTGSPVTLTATGATTYTLQLNGTTLASAFTSPYTFTPAASGTYTVTATVNGCTSNTVSIPLTVVATPPTPASAGAARYGSGPVTLSVTSPNSTLYNYNWYTAADAFLATGTSYTPSVSANTSYKLRALTKVAPICTSAAASVTATVWDVPATAASGPLLLHPTTNPSITLSVSGTHAQYAWYRDGVQVATTPTLSVSTVGKYRVMVTNPVPGSYTTPEVDITGSLDYQNQNMITTRTALAPGLTEAQLKALPRTQVTTSVAYFDGLGRPWQSVGMQASPAGYDVVQPVEYDARGLEPRKYAPYVAAANSGFLQNGWKTAQSAFYATPPSPTIAATPNPYADTDFEASPLARVREQGAVGSPWQIVRDVNGNSTRTGHTLRITERPNLANEVRLWLYSYPAGATPGTAASAAAYAAGQLWMKETQDENNNLVRTYTDKQGLVVCRKVQLGADPNNPDHWAETQYIYDDFNQQRIVIQPEGVKALRTGGWNLTQTIRDQFCFQYNTDGRRRVIESYVPGGGWVHTVYNDADLPILTQDANQRTRNEWTYIRYDVPKRPISTGTLIDARTRAQHATDAATWASTHTQLESRGATAITGPFRTGTAAMPYTNAQSYPAIATPAPNTLSYYDDYDFDGDNTPDAAYAFVPDAAFPALAPHPWPIGLPTGTATRVKTPSQADQLLRNIQYYDSKNRVVYTYAEEYPAGTTQTWTEYNFVGWVMKRKTKQVFASRTTTVLDSNQYDHAGRLLRTWQSVNAAPKTQVVEYAYNELGQLVKKNVHKKPDNSFAQTINQRYNERGWLTTLTATLFQLQLDYNSSAVPGTQPNYNGNITASTWTHLGETGKAYRFTYDRMSRLLDAESFSLTAPNTYTNDNAVREGFIDYDLNGNILRLKRALNGTLLDELTYRYAGNRLMAVLDASTDATETYFKDNGALITTDDYGYDASGNMTSDANKKILSITYNNANLPTRVNLQIGANTTDNYYQFIYDEANTLRRRIVSEGGLLKTTDYVAGFQYENNTLDFLPQPEGYVKANPNNTFSYKYTIKDYLGSTRVVVNEDGSVDQMNDYYPFGLEIYRTGAVAQWQFKYNGKENQNRLGLGWINYGARYYDAQLTRWLSSDPLASKYMQVSSFVYVKNNPINALDPDGRRIIFVNGHYQDNWIGRNILGSDKPGRDYWSYGFEQAAARYFGDYSKNNIFVNGSSLFGGDQSGGDRYKNGYEYAKAHYAELTSNLGKDEAFEFVTHSEGSAYGAGIAAFLIEKGHKVESVLHLNPDEGDEFSTPDEPYTKQVDTAGDWITGNKKIDGIDSRETLRPFGPGDLNRVTGSHGQGRSADVFSKISPAMKGSEMKKLNESIKSALNNALMNRNYKVKETKNGTKVTFTD